MVIAHRGAQFESGKHGCIDLGKGGTDGAARILRFDLEPDSHDVAIAQQRGGIVGQLLPTPLAAKGKGKWP